jgi:hypothetical protein
VCWPLARAGFFGMSKGIPALLDRFGFGPAMQAELRY